MVTKKITVYVIGDDEDDFELIKDAIHEVNALISTCHFTDCQGFLAFIQNQEHAVPSLILLDMSMHFAGNIECLRVIKQTERLKNIPVYIYSSSTYSPHIDEALDLGTRYVQKPSTFAGIKKMMDSMLHEITR